MRTISLLASIAAALSIVHVAAVAVVSPNAVTRTTIKTSTAVTKTTTTISTTVTKTVTTPTSKVKTATTTTTNTVSSTVTNTVSATVTNTVSATVTNTVNATVTNTVSATVTNSVSTTETDTVSATVTGTVCNTATTIATPTTTGDTVYGTPRPGAVLWYTTDNLNVSNYDQYANNDWLHLTTLSTGILFSLQHDATMCAYDESTGDAVYCTNEDNPDERCNLHGGCFFVFLPDGRACINIGPDGENGQSCTLTSGTGHSIMLQTKSPFLGVYDADGNFLTSTLYRVATR